MFVIGFYDRVANVYRDLGVVEDVRVFKRTVGIVMTTREAPYLWAQFPEDHDLYVMATVDATTGIVKPMEAGQPVFECHLTDLVSTTPARPAADEMVGDDHERG